MAKTSIVQVRLGPLQRSEGLKEPTDGLCKYLPVYPCCTPQCFSPAKLYYLLLPLSGSPNNASSFASDMDYYMHNHS